MIDGYVKIFEQEGVEHASMMAEQPLFGDGATDGVLQYIQGLTQQGALPTLHPYLYGMDN